MSVTTNSNFPYVCSLSAEIQKIALDELHEDENIRTQALQQFREWIQKHPTIKNCPVDNLFLLRFLRGHKFNITDSGNRLEKFLEAFQLRPKWFRNLTTTEYQKLIDFIDMGFVYIVPQSNSKQELAAIIKMSVYNTDYYTPDNCFQVLILLVLALSGIEENQIKRCNIIFDSADLSMKQAATISLLDFRNFVKLFFSSTTVRIAAIAAVNLPSIALPFVDIVKTMLSSKMNSRFHFSKDDSIIYNLCELKSLPTAYGGEASHAQLIEDLKLRINEQIDNIREFENASIMFVKSNSNEPDNFDNDTGISGSFRTLEVD